MNANAYISLLFTLDLDILSELENLHRNQYENTCSV